MKELFEKLFWAKTEDDVSDIINTHRDIFREENWHLYGGIVSNYSIIENQQANPIAALIEKLTNSIDAILMKKCHEKNIDPKSDSAPQSIEDAVQQYFPGYKNWDLPSKQFEQSENIQILAHGPRKNTSLVIYDNGEGQHPADFENTLLSLIRGNKNEIPFVQGKYNMGGTGAIVFCGNKRYQLIASKRHDGTGNFGFTLCRRHVLSQSAKAKNTWYEYLKIDGSIPNFPIAELDLGLHNRNFTTGTVIKLYSYRLPAGAKSVISRDLNMSINEYLFEPALPVCTVESKVRYPDDRNPERSLYGLKRRLESDAGQKYINAQFSEDAADPTMGTFKITGYVFNLRRDNGKPSKADVRREFFKNNMSVLFSVNGQVHGHFTFEFISRTLKMELLKNHLLIHVDCTQLHQSFRNELFMASRDRLKESEESSTLRKKVAEILGKSDLKNIYKDFKNQIMSAGEDADSLLQNLSENLPLDKDFARLLDQVINTHRPGTKKTKRKKTIKKKTKHRNLQRFPSTLKIDTKLRDEEQQLPLVMLPLGTDRPIRFNTDVQDDYFDRVEESGSMSISLLDYKPSRHPNPQPDPQPNPHPTNLGKILSVRKSNPRDGVIHVHMKATDEVAVGDALRMEATLSSPSGKLNQIFLIAIEDKPQKKKERVDDPPPQLGLPECKPVKGKDWDSHPLAEFDLDKVMHPLTDGGKLKVIYINMGSSVFMNYVSQFKGEKEIEVAKKRYITAVYFHALFLHLITESGKYKISTEKDEPLDTNEYLHQIFSNRYAEFLLKFGANDFMSFLED